MTETNLFGETRAVDRFGRCLHTNCDLRLEVHGSIRVESRQTSSGSDFTDEVARKISWGGHVHGRCLDCDKQLYYTASTLPKRLKLRLALFEGLDELDGRRIVEQ